MLSGMMNVINKSEKKSFQGLDSVLNLKKYALLKLDSFCSFFYSCITTKIENALENWRKPGGPCASDSRMFLYGEAYLESACVNTSS